MIIVSDEPTERIQQTQMNITFSRTSAAVSSYKTVCLCGLMHYWGHC